MDLFSQASRRSWPKAFCCGPDAAYIERCSEIDRLAARDARAEIIAKSLNGRGALIRTRQHEEACEISNRIAPEHLGDRQPRPAQVGALLNTPARFPGCLHE